MGLNVADSTAESLRRPDHSGTLLCSGAFAVVTVARPNPDVTVGSRVSEQDAGPGWFHDDDLIFKTNPY